MYLFFKASLGRNREDWDWGQRRNEMDRETFAVFLHLQEEKEEEQFSSNYRRSRRILLKSSTNQKQNQNQTQNQNPGPTSSTSILTNWTGLNAATDLSFLHHTLDTYSEIAAFLKQAYFMRVSDVDAAFSLLPLHPDLWPFFPLTCDA